MGWIENKKNKKQETSTWLFYVLVDPKVALVYHYNLNLSLLFAIYSSFYEISDCVLPLHLVRMLQSSPWLILQQTFQVSVFW